MSDPTIERIEAELRESRTQAWDVETFLANRYRAKIEALTKAEDKPWQRRWIAAKEVWWAVAGVVGSAAIATIAGLWLLLGEFPFHRDLMGHDAYFHRMEPNGLIPPAPAPVVRINR